MAQVVAPTSLRAVAALLVRGTEKSLKAPGEEVRRERGWRIALGGPGQIWDTRGLERIGRVCTELPDL